MTLHTGGLGHHWKGKGRQNHQAFTDPTVYEKICLELSSNIDMLTPQGISNVIWGLAKMEINWNDEGSLSNTLKSKLLAKIMQVIQSKNELTLSTIIYSMGVLEIDINSEQLKTILESVSVYLQQKIITEQGLSNILYGFSKLKINKVSFPTGFSVRLFESILKVFPKTTQQAMGNILYALHSMGYAYGDFTSEFRTALDRELIR